MVQSSRGWIYLLGLTTRDGSITKVGVVGGGVEGWDGVGVDTATVPVVGGVVA